MTSDENILKVDHAKLHAAMARGPAAFVASAPETIAFWTDDEYVLVFGHAKPLSPEDQREIVWKEVRGILDDKPGTNILANQPDADLVTDRLIAWAETQPTLRQLLVGQDQFCLIYQGRTYPPDYPGVVWTRS